jgi:YfiH family protein
MLQRTTHSNGVVTYQSPLLQSIGVVHGFSTRIGGISRPPFDSLNLQLPARHDDPTEKTCIMENFRRLRTALNVQRLARVQVNQVHGCAVWVPPADERAYATAPEADAIASDQPDKLVTIRVADCVPVLLASADGRVVAAVHAGWRGMVAGVIEQAARTMLERWSLSPSDLIAAVGPCIGPEHFEVGPEVAAEFERTNLTEAIRPGDSGGNPHVDLPRSTVTQLARVGVSTDRIDTTDRCTFRDGDEFFSHRRDRGVTGRMAAIIVARA